MAVNQRVDFEGLFLGLQYAIIEESVSPYQLQKVNVETVQCRDIRLFSYINSQGGFDDTFSCLLMGIPASASIQDVLTFISPFLSLICGVKVLIDHSVTFSESDSVTSQVLYLLKFNEKESLESFKLVYNSLPFSPVCMKNDIDEVGDGVDLCVVLAVSTDDNKPLIMTSIDKHIQCGWLPRCAVCIRRIKSSLTGLSQNTIISKQFPSSCCLVCRVIHGLIPSQNIWICLICGHMGCGRYSSQHAKMHFDRMQHGLALELASGRIWDYEHDTFVHLQGSVSSSQMDHQFSTLVRSTSASAKPSVSVNLLSTKEISALPRQTRDKLDSLSLHYESLLQCQLKEQQLYYEKQLARETSLALQRSHLSAYSQVLGSGIVESDVVREEVIEEELLIIEQHQLSISALEAEFGGLRELIRENEQLVREARKRNGALIRSQKLQMERLATLKQQQQNIESLRQQQESELRQQSQTHVEEVLDAAEVAGAELLVLTPSPSTAHNNKKSARKRK